MAEKEQKWCIEAINKITNKREIISKDVSKEQAEKMRRNYVYLYGPKKQRPYRYLKIVQYNPQKNLFYL